MSKELVITISPEGSVESLHMDSFPLSFLGRMEVERASTIEFDRTRQSFFVRLTEAASPLHGCQPYDGIHCAREFQGYDEARAFEVEWLTESAKQSVDPLSPEGIEIACKLRFAELAA
jgi:hypothetical protein